MRTSIALALVSAAIGAPAMAAGGGFQSGDLYLYTPAFQGSSSLDGALVRIDKTTFAVDLIVDTTATPQGQGISAYDPYRDRIVFQGAVNGGPSQLFATDAAGNLQPLAATANVSNLAPRGDGKIYLTGTFATVNAIWYLDCNDQIQPLLDVTGTVPFQPFGLGSGDFRGMIYDVGTNSLLLASSAASGCGTGTFNSMANVRRIPLTLDGTRVAGPMSCNSFDVDTNQGGEIPAGWSRAPGGELALVVDTNSNAQQSRMLLVDPVTLGITPFAANGSYTGAAATNAGTWSSALGKFLILDTFGDQLRAFGVGETGAGSVVATSQPLSSSGSSEQPALFEIEAPSSHAVLSVDVAGISLAAGGTQTIHVSAGCVYAGATYAVLGSISGTAPGFTLQGKHVPLNFDSYTQFTLQSPNTAVLAASIGTLDATGSGQALFSLPAGAPAALAGLVLHHAALVVTAGGVVAAVSNPVAVTLVP